MNLISIKQWSEIEKWERQIKQIISSFGQQRLKQKEEDEPPLQKGQKEKEGKNTHELPSITEQ